MTTNRSEAASGGFLWDDPLLFQEALLEDERILAESARKFCNDKLMPRVLGDHRHETFDRSIMTDLGTMGFLGPTIPEEFGGAGVNAVSYGLIAREIERVDSGYRSAMSVQSSLVMYPIYAYGSDVQRAEISAATGDRRIGRMFWIDRT